MNLIKGSYFKNAFVTIRNAKLRNFWTILGVIIGVTSFILVVGISEGIKLQIATQVNQYGKDIITVRPSLVQVSGSSLDSLSLLTGVNVSGSLSRNDLKIIEGSKDVSSVVPESVMSAKIVGTQGSYRNGLVIGTTPNFLSFLNQSLSYGSFLNSNVSSNQVVVGSSAAGELFNVDVPLGQTVMINNQPFVVEGILNPFPSTPLSSGSEFNKALFITYNQAMEMTNNTITTYQIMAKPSKPNLLDQAKGHIYNNLLQSHNGQNNFEVLDQTQSANSTTGVLKLINKLIIGLSIISLTVGGIGIMNVMLVSVTERYHEIGIRKALGATNRQILNQFLIESTTLSTIGGLIGIILAYVIDLVMRMFTNIQPSISWQIVALAFGASLIVGVVFGSLPALKAAKKAPIDALRSE
ncbi:MAG: ABC transporter permease [Patescibacteria group bacterium]|jgi:putative ABC transport system permease protein|nr:ABC transporter permease [Patescibacteria group bacterium]